ncbi:MAG: LLM class flavin-dependent oxidoreductase, partial [Ilumatobacteraceae bacterium]|nr:LLM class flavin-dependent oxidoreductase [Ilumatobacteraceae bacterium]
MCGVDPATPGRRTDATLSAVRALLDGKVVDGDGEFFDFVDATIRPTPADPIPVLVGGRRDAAIERGPERDVAELEHAQRHGHDDVVGLVQPCVAVGQDNPVVETVIDLDDWRVVVDCVGDAQEHVGLVEVEPARSDELAVDIEDDRFDRHRDDAVVDVRDLVVVGVLHKLRGDLDVVV